MPGRAGKRSGKGHTLFLHGLKGTTEWEYVLSTEIDVIRRDGHVLYT